jgi:hypothetical protein
MSEPLLDEIIGSCNRVHGAFSYENPATAYYHKFSRSPKLKGDFLENYPHFRKPTAYSGVDDIKIAPTGSFRQVRQSNGQLTTHLGVLCKFSYPPTATTNYSSYCKSHAVLRAYKDLQDRKINFGIAAAQAHKTFDLVNSNTRQFLKFYRQLRRGQLTAAARTLGLNPKKIMDALRLKGHVPYGSKEFSRRLLEYSYGWKPLMADIHGSIEEYHRLTGSPLPFVTGKGGMKVDDLWQLSGQSSTSAATSSRFPHFYEHNFNKKQTAKVRLDYVVGDKSLADLSRLGILNPLEVAWDLVPYSFVVDWFVPVSGYIQAFTADAGLSFLKGSVTESCTTVINSSYTPQQSVGYERSGEGIAYSRRFAFKRLVYNSPPGLPIYPPIGYPKSMTQALQALALLRVRFR